MMKNKYAIKAKYYELLGKLVVLYASKTVNGQVLCKLANWFESKSDFYQMLSKLFTMPVREYDNEYFEAMLEDTMLVMEMILAS